MRGLHRTIASQVGWIAMIFVAQQVVRLGSNIILAKLLAPSIFGVMLILNTWRTGIELLSDVGIGQNIVFDKAGNRPKFYNTAWTLQIIRGVLLFSVFLLLSGPIGNLYNDPELDKVLPIFAAIFLIAGIAPPTRSLFQKRHRTTAIVTLDMVNASIISLTTIAFAYFMPNVLGMVLALLSATLVTNIGAAFLMNWRNLRVMLDREFAVRILSFGKWVFIASAFYFAAVNFDRLYLGTAIPMALLGVFGIARTFSDAIFLLVQKIANLIVFPRIAEARSVISELRHKIAKPRRLGIALAAIGLGSAISVSDLIILFLYDERYHGAAAILPILLIGTWFSILCAVSEAMMYGIGKPAYNAVGNATKLAGLAIFVPAAIASGNFPLALVLIAISDLPRYAVLAFYQWRVGLSFVVQDLALTAFVPVVAVILRLALLQIGLVQTILPGAELLSHLSIN